MCLLPGTISRAIEPARRIALAAMEVNIPALCHKLRAADPFVPNAVCLP